MEPDDRHRPKRPRALMVVFAAVMTAVLIATLRGRSTGGGPLPPLPVCSASYSVNGPNLDVAVASNFQGAQGGTVAAEVNYGAVGSERQDRSAAVGPGRHLNRFVMSNAPGAEVSGIVTNRRGVGNCGATPNGTPPSLP